MTKRNWKLVLFWAMGAVCILLGSMIAGNLERNVGVSESSFWTTLTIAFVLFLVGGILWISVATASKALLE